MAKAFRSIQTVSIETGHLERAARQVVRRARTGVASLLLALFLISPACASRTTATASGAPSGLSFVIAAERIAGLPIAPETSYRRTLRYFARAGQRGSSSFPDGLCRLRFEKIGLSMTFVTLAADAATPANCKLPMAVVTGSRWHTANGLPVGATVASMHRLFPRAYNSGKTEGRHWSIPTGSTVWWLGYRVSSSHAARPVLTAYVKDGHVAALGITIVGH
jgi:hypothetical protein